MAVPLHGNGAESLLGKDVLLLLVVATPDSCRTNVLPFAMRSTSARVQTRGVCQTPATHGNDPTLDLPAAYSCTMVPRGGLIPARSARAGRSCLEMVANRRSNQGSPAPRHLMRPGEQLSARLHDVGDRLKARYRGIQPTRKVCIDWRVNNQRQTTAAPTPDIDGI